jgi:hypothetical protein
MLKNLYLKTDITRASCVRLLNDVFVMMCLSLNRYKIEDVDRDYLELTATVKLCLEESTCLYESELFNKQRIPKPGCNWNLNFTKPGEKLTL